MPQKYPDRVCEKCGRVVKGNEYGSQVYFPCRQCNEAFWEKWHTLPKTHKVNGIWQYTDEHISLIDEYHKWDYFKMKRK